MIKLLDILKEIKVHPVPIGDNVTFKDWIKNNIIAISDVMYPNLRSTNHDEYYWDIDEIIERYKERIPDDKIYRISHQYLTIVFWVSTDAELLRRYFLRTKITNINGKEIAYINP
jgi:hypothetical protein